ANVNTEGYSRQDVVLKDTAPTKAANMFFGTGVALEAVKRQFDVFAESNLRNSTSDLSSQKPMVDYTKRVMDIMGDKSVGLSSALDDFFTSANALSADPASTVLRSSFLRSSEGVSSRFAELSGQLNLVGTETSQALESTTNQVNTLTSQLALVNQNMARSATEDGQSAEILDRRDLILRQLSDLVRIKTTFATNGSVSVALGNTATQGVVVDGLKSRPIGIDTSVPGKTELLLDPYGHTESLASASGGQLGGLQTFISQVLEPAQKSLNFLAKTLVTETNTIQKNGIDGYGQTGQALFVLDPQAKDEAAGISVALTDALRVATAAQFRVTENTSNSSDTRASVTFTAGPEPVGISNTSLVNNPNPSAGVTIKVDGSRVMAPVTTLAAGVKATFYLDDAKPGQQLQVLTRDGRQLLGQTLSETEKFQMLNAQNGFVPNSIYSDAYLNKSAAAGYRGMDVFYGAMATVRHAQVFDKNGVAAPPITEPAVLTTSRITDLPAGSQIPAGAILLNGVAMPALVTQAETPLSPNDVAAWVNGKSQIAITQPNFTGVSLSVGGVALSVQNLAPVPNDLPTLASDLQDQLRMADGTDYLSVSVASNGTDLQIDDALGRNISNVYLTPSAGNISGGDVTVSNSLISQTGVRADVYNDIQVPAQQIDFTKSLKINDQVVPSGYKDVSSLVAAINGTTGIG
ncbi:MAG: flagellar hook-associated protein FlgK, partial [Betaproteobacteria bacterium]|nr:flagellar hook-associated protein FlgK [Betaproteobacteria bacterium]